MPIDIVQLRAAKGGDPERFREFQRRRFKSESIIDEVIQLDDNWRQARFQFEQLRSRQNQLQKQVAQLKKQNPEDESAAPLIEEIKELDTQIKEAKELDIQAEQALNAKLNLIGNEVHDSVPVSRDENDNRVERTWGEPRQLKIDNELGRSNHHAVLSRLDGYDSARGVKLVGHRGYILKGWGVLLNQALINFGLNFLMEKGYNPIQPPFFMSRSTMALTAELADFDDQLYKVSTGDENDPDSQYYLIATSEQPISCMHQGEWLEDKDLPMKYAGYSSCFRKEAGAHGRDTWGIFRIHQFEKVEQFCITTPEKSWEMHEEMIGCAEEFYQRLNLPYRVVAIVSGELNNAAAKKYDLEAWFPSYGNYRELVSCSNCTDYQSRAAEVRCGVKKQNQQTKRYVHMLNATLCATERALCCVLENYQTEEGLIVPEALRPYIGNREFIPYVRELTKQEKKQY